MREINLSRLSTHLFAALMLFLAGFSALSLLDLPVAGVVLFVAGLLFVTLAFVPTHQPPEA